MINLIAAMGVNREIGYKNQLLCHLPNDLQHFKKLTTGNVCIMGRKTYDSIGKPLPNRYNIVLSKNVNLDLHDSVYVYNSVDDILHEYYNYSNKESEIFVLGGETLYKQFLPHADRIYMTVIESHFPKVDTWFPPFSFLDWKVTSNIRNEIDEKNPYVHHFLTYSRRRK